MIHEKVTQCGALHRAVAFLIQERVPHNGAVAVVRVTEEQDTLWNDLFTAEDRGTQGLWQVSFRHMPIDHPSFGGTVPEDPMELDQSTFPVFVDEETGACAILPTL